MRRGGAAPSLGLLPEKETGRIGVFLGRRLCGSSLQSRAGEGRRRRPQPRSNTGNTAATDSKEKQEEKMR